MVYQDIQRPEGIDICSDMMEPHITGRQAPKFKNVVLVGHGIENEARIMEGLQMDLESMTPLIAILDTRRTAAHIFGRNPTLGRLMRRLGCPHAHLHHAGNDAMSH